MQTQLVITFKEGSSNKDMAAHLRFQAGLLEGMQPKAASSRKNTDAPVEEPETDDTDADDDDEDFAAKPKKGKGKAVASFDADDDDADESAETDDDEEETPAPTKKKTAKVTLDDVNDACKAKAKSSDRKTVLGILKKKFKVGSVTDLEPTDYAAVIKAMAV